MGRNGGPASDRFTPQAVEHMLGQLEARAAEASDETLTSAVVTGRRALAEWQDLAGRLRDLNGEYERLAQCESRALSRLECVLDLLDKFVEPSELAPAPIRPGHEAPGRLTQAPRPSPSRDTRGSLAVRMLGAFELTIDGQRVTDWRGQRTQSLMQFLTAHRHRSVLRDELIVAVWPDVDEDNGRHRLHQAVYELRRILHSIDPDRSPVVCIEGGYRVDHEVPIWVDVEEFDDLVSAASRCFAARRSDEAIDVGRRALNLYRGDFLGQATCADWATAERSRLRARFVQLSIHLGELLAGRGDHAAALAVVDPVLSMEPWNEDATVVTMRCHARSGARSMAAAAYRSCAAALTREFGITPAAQTSRVYNQIRSAEPRGKPGGLTADRARTAPRPPSPSASGAAQPSRLRVAAALPLRCHCPCGGTPPADPPDPGQLRCGVPGPRPAARRRSPSIPAKQPHPPVRTAAALTRAGRVSISPTLPVPSREAWSRSRSPRDTAWSVGAAHLTRLARLPARRRRPRTRRAAATGQAPHQMGRTAVRHQPVRCPSATPPTPGQVPVVRCRGGRVNGSLETA